MHEWSLRREVGARIPTKHGTFQLNLYTSDHDDKEHLAFVMGDVTNKEHVLLRVHSECFTGDVLGSLRCDCGEQLERAMATIGKAGQGVIVYMRQEGRGIGLLDKLRAYNLQDEGLDTVEANLRLGHQADERDYTVAAMIIHELGIKSVDLLTNNPKKIEDLRKMGTPISERVPVETPIHSENRAYMLTKVERMRHMLTIGNA